MDITGKIAFIIIEFIYVQKPGYPLEWILPGFFVVYLVADKV